MQSGESQKYITLPFKEIQTLQSKEIVPKSLIITLKEQPVHCSVQMSNNVM